MLSEVREGEETVAVVGLGYVGLPLVLALARHYETIGYDVDTDRIAAYQAGLDPSRELESDAFEGTRASFTSDPQRLREATVIIVAVPTPIDATRRPDLSALESATATVGSNMAAGTIVVFESTVYPGATEDVCGPVLERSSGLAVGTDFHLAYSPERINPGDAAHSLEQVVKIVACGDSATLKRVDDVYRHVVKAGTYPTPSIRVAEAAKVLENTQRDLNIALMNEMSLIFDRAGIDTNAVIDAASTKWNFADYRPGLVGGHCIGVDPYYLTHLAETLGYHPDVILAGRRVNDSMGRFVARATIKQLISAGKNIGQARVAVLGVTFKENVADLRNSRAEELVDELSQHGVEVVLADPCADPDEVRATYGIGLTPTPQLRNLDGIVAAVRHRQFEALDIRKLRELCRYSPVLVDVRGLYSSGEAIAGGFRYWRL